MVLHIPQQNLYQFLRVQRRGCGRLVTASGIGARNALVIVVQTLAQGNDNQEDSPPELGVSQSRKDSSQLFGSIQYRGGWV